MQQHPAWPPGRRRTMSLLRRWHAVAAPTVSLFTGSRQSEPPARRPFFDLQHTTHRDRNRGTPRTSTPTTYYTENGWWGLLFGRSYHKVVTRLSRPRTRDAFVLLLLTYDVYVCCERFQNDQRNRRCCGLLVLLFVLLYWFIFSWEFPLLISDVHFQFFHSEVSAFNRHL